MLTRPFTGVIAAPFLPMRDGGDIDWAALERYMDWIAAQAPGGIAMNMDASEVIALDEDEQVEVVRVCLGASGRAHPSSPAWSPARPEPPRRKRRSSPGPASRDSRCSRRSPPSRGRRCRRR